MASARNFQVGDLVRLNTKGHRFIYGKTLCNPYYDPVLKSNLGIVIDVGDPDTNLHTYIKVAWIADQKDSKNFKMIINRRYLKRLNKRQS